MQDRTCSPGRYIRNLIREKSGDIPASDTEALVNTVGVMGKGIAPQFKRTHSDMFREYAQAARDRDLQTGRMFVWQTGTTTGPRLVINFQTKRHWRSASRFIECMTYE